MSQYRKGQRIEFHATARVMCGTVVKMEPGRIWVRWDHGSGPQPAYPGDQPSKVVAINTRNPRLRPATPPPAGPQETRTR
jgi:hypothetical protein